MTPSTLTAIILAVLLGASLMIAANHFRTARNLRTQLNGLRGKIDRYRDADNDTNPVYTIRRTRDGEIAVCRVSTQRGYFHNTLIKVFNDPDEGFNLREAEELRDKLNAR